MQMRRLSPDAPPVSAVGLGCMGLSGSYGPADDAASIATIQAAIEAGITFLDTGDFYGMGHNELLLREAIRGRRDQVFLSVKFGALRAPSGAFIGHDARPEFVKSSLAYTLTRLGTDYVDLYQPARLSPHVPVEDTVGAIAEMIAAGHVRHLGLSEASAASVARAQAVHPVLALQTEYSLAAREIEGDTLPALRGAGIGLVAYGVMTRGLLAGVGLDGADALPHTDARRRQPRFQGDNLAHNQRAVAAFAEVAREAGLNPGQLALAWVLSRGKDVVALYGTRRRDRLLEAVRVAQSPPASEVIAAAEAALPPGAILGARYEPAQMTMVGR